MFPFWDSRRCLRALSRAWVDGVPPAGPPVGRASPRCYPRIRHRSSSVRRERGRCCPVSRPAVVHCRGRILWFHFVAGPLHGDVVRNVCLAPQQIRPFANLHLEAALVGHRVAAITIHAGEDLHVALFVWVRTFPALGAAGLLRSRLLLGVPKGLTLGAPSHRCGKSLHRERCGTEPYLTGQLRCFQGDLDGKRGLLLAVVESDDPRYAMPSRFQILSDEFQLVATHGDGPPYSLDHGSWNPGSYGDPPGQLVQACQLALLGLSGASNEPLPGGFNDGDLVSLFKISQSANVRLEGLDGLNKRLSTSVRHLLM